MTTACTGRGRAIAVRDQGNLVALEGGDHLHERVVAAQNAQIVAGQEAASRTSAESTNCSNLTMSPPRTTK